MGYGDTSGYLQQCPRNLSLMENLLLIDLHFAMPAGHVPIMTAVKSIDGLSIHIRDVMARCFPVTCLPPDSTRPYRTRTGLFTFLPGIHLE